MTNNAHLHGQDLLKHTFSIRWEKYQIIYFEELPYKY